MSKVRRVRDAIEVEPGVCRIQCPFCLGHIGQPFSRVSGPVDGTHGEKGYHRSRRGSACRVIVTPHREGGWLVEQVPEGRSIERVLSERSAKWQGAA